jgi:hypothetical protein
MLSRRAAVAALAAVLATSLTGCARPREWRVRIVLSLSGAAGRPVNGIDVSVALPAGASAPHEAGGGRIASQALALRGGAAAATLDGKYVSHPTNPYVRILLASREPMRDGEVTAVELTVTSSVTPPRERFEVVRSMVSGPDGATVPGAGCWVSGVQVE